MSLMRMTLVLAGICWVNRGFWSSKDMNSCWLDESALFAVTAVKSKRWNHPSAPTATTKFWQNRKKERIVMTTNAPKYQCFACTNLSFIANISDGDTGQLETQTRNQGLKERGRVPWWWPLASALTMPTHVLVTHGLDSSFLYTSNFPLVSPTTSSFSYSQQRQTALKQI